MLTSSGLENRRSESSRLSCRLDARIKRRAAEAAALIGQSITGFTEAALEERADSVFRQVERLELSGRDFQRFLDAIATPAPPTPELAIAMKEYEQARNAEPEGGW